MLQQISIQNFKSLKDVTLDLQQVNLLIGPNNSGKTNLLKALEFLKNALLKKSPDFIADVDIKQYSFKHQEAIINYTITWIVNGLIQKVEIRFGDLHDGLASLQLKSVNDSENSFINDTKINFSENRSLYFILRDIRIYRPDSNKIPTPFPLILNDGTISGDASDLIPFLDRIRDSNPEIFDAIQTDLRYCIPEFSGIRFATVLPNDKMKEEYGDKTFKIFGLYHTKHRETYWANELSEGTLYFLALLCIIHQLNPPKLLLLEEPERGIHPRRIREVMDFIFRLAEEKDIQVIMTTHSTQVLDEFKDLPGSVFIFDKDEEGATQVKNLLHDVIEPSNKANNEKGLPLIKFTEGLGEHWQIGFLGGVPK